MTVQPIQITLLNHLFYYTEVSGGGTSATATGAFIGDLALTYAFERILMQSDIYERLSRKRPKYEEIRDFGFYCTVAKPLEIKRTENYIRNTLFNIDGFIDVKSIEKSGKSPFKNFRQVQGIAAGSKFHALLISKEPLQMPPILRVGTGRETMLDIQTVEPLKKADYWLNAFTLKAVFGNLEKASNLMIREGNVNFNYIIENYNLIKKLKKEHVEEVFAEIF
jgi:CRISPR type I-D-associated protein Csc1